MTKSINIKKLALSAVVFIIIWNLIDFGLDTFVTHTPFMLTPSSFITPAIISVACDLLFGSPLDKNE